MTESSARVAYNYMKQDTFFAERMTILKETTTTELIKEKTLKNDTTVGLLLHIATAICAFLFSNAPIMKNLLPFGAAFTSGVKRKYLSAASAGAAIGYLFNLSGGGFVYIASVFAITTVRIILGNEKFSNSPVFSGCLAFAAAGIIRLAVSSSYGGNITMVITEAALASSTAYFVAIVFKISPTEKSGTDIKETTALSFFAAVLLLSLSKYGILELSIGRILAVSVILATARYGQASYGAVSGSIISFVLAIAGNDYFVGSVTFAFSGLICGIFSALGSIGMIAAYLATTLISTFIIGENGLISVMFFEAVIGSGAFLLLPKKLVGYIGGLLSPTTQISKLDSVKGALIMRLEFASGALKDVYETVEDVAKKLGKINSPDFDYTLNKVEDEVCGGCSLRRHCWETAKEITATDALATWNRLKRPSAERDEKDEESNFKCLRMNKFENALKKHCSEYESKRSAELRLREVRNVINDQFDGISRMLSDLSNEFKYDVCHDNKAAENIILSLKNIGYHAVNCIAAKDKFGRISADIHIKGVTDIPVNKMTILKHLSLAVGRDFDTPMVSTTGDEAFIFITERPNFKIEIGLSQIPEEQGKLCGDSAKYFSDGRGRFILLISDGMGTGGRAAVDSAMVSGLFSRMLRSGFGYDCSLKIINSSMIFKSTDESLATIDIATIDLFSGECELLKAGAAPTFIKRSAGVGKAESRSLPPGILRNISFDKATVNLRAEDIIVMVSDGVITEGSEWISNIINQWSIGSAQQLADEIAFAARRRRSDGHNDDITVMVGILKKNY